MTRDQRKGEEREKASGGERTGGERGETRRVESPLAFLSPGSKCGVLARVSWLIARGAATGLVWILSY